MLIDIVDENDNVIGQKEKDDVHRDGDLHRVVHVWVLNSKNELLCHRRADSKKVYPGFWDIIVGGHLNAGETYEDAALREVEEEIGIKFSKDDMVFIGNWKGNPNDQEPRIREFSKSFAILYDSGIETMKMDTEEMSELKFVPIEELKRISKNPEEKKKFVTFKTFEKFIGKIESMYRESMYRT